MDEDTVKGKGKDIAGRVQRQVGEWTGDEDMQAEGAGRQTEGKIQAGIGKIKEVGRDMAGKLKEKSHDIRRDDKHDEDVRDEDDDKDTNVA